MPRSPEFALIDAFVRATGVAPRSPRGPGDDAAVLPRSRALEVVTVDAVVEDVHFRRATATLGDVGWKALAVNLSDVAAMGAAPRWALVALGVPAGFGRSEARALGRGFGALARDAGVALVGGNVTRAPGLSLTVTVGGEAPRRPLLRSGARPGDDVWVSGTLGDARLGLAWLEAGGRGRARRRGPAGAVARQRRPVPRLALGLRLAEVARACLDVSDGLVQDAGHLAAATGVALVLHGPVLPVSRALTRAFPDDDARWREAARGGEDYELLFTAARSRADAVRRAAARAGTPVTRIGTVERGRGVRVLDASGRPVRGLAGHDHLARARAPTR